MVGRAFSVDSNLPFRIGGFLRAFIDCTGCCRIQANFLNRGIVSWQVLRVRSRLAGSDAAKKLKDGDMLLAINSTPVWGYRDVEAFVENLTPGPYRMGGKRTFSIAFPSSSEENSATASETAVMETKALSLELTLFRDHQLMKEVIHLGEETGWGTERMVHWCGAQLQVITLFYCPFQSLSGEKENIHRSEGGAVKRFSRRDKSSLYKTGAGVKRSRQGSGER